MREITLRPWMSWAEALELREWSGAIVKVAAKSSRPDAIKTISPQRREQLAAVFTKLLGRPMQVELVVPAPPAGAAPADASGRVSTKQQAMNLPIVRNVMEIFDATLIEFRPAGTPEKTPDAPADALPLETPAPPPVRPKFDDAGDDEMNDDE